MKSLMRGVRTLLFNSVILTLLIQRCLAVNGHWIPINLGGFQFQPTGKLAAKDGVLFEVNYAAGGCGNQAINAYDTCSDSWSVFATPSFASGCGTYIQALLVSGQYLYAAGQFEEIGGVWATNIAKYDFVAGTWSPVGDGSLTNKRIVAVTIPMDNPNNVYVALDVGAEFTGDTPVDTELVKRWNGAQWETVGQGILASTEDEVSFGINVQALTTDGTNVYVAGFFLGAISNNGQGVGSRNLIKWNPLTGAWEQEAIRCQENENGVPVCYADSAPSYNINALATRQVPQIGTVIFGAGSFWSDPVCCDLNPPRGIYEMIPGTYANRATYISYGDCSQGYNSGQGNSVATYAGNLFLGGNFDAVECSMIAYGVAQIPAEDPTHWHAIGSATALTINSQSGTSPAASTLGIAADQYSVYVVGSIDYVEGVPCSSGFARLPYASPNCSDKLAWWRMEGNGVDTAVGHNGSIVNSFAFTAGKYGQGIYTSGKPGGLSVANASALNFGSGADFTLEAWVKPESASTSYGILNIIDKRVVSGALVGYEFALSNGQLIFQMASTSGQELDAGPSGTDLRADGNWHHVAVTVQRGSPTGGKFYVDGIQVGTSFDPTSVSGDLTSTAPLLIGMHPDASLDCNFRGNIDEPGVYSRALTASEISGIFNSGKQCSGCLPANAVAWWPLDGDGTDTVGGNNGVIKDTFDFLPDQSGQYAQLNGKAGGLNVADASDLNFGTSGDFTIEAWVKPQNANTSFQVMDIVDKRVTSGTVVGYELALSNGKLTFQMASTSGQMLNVPASGNNLRDGNWHHVAVTVQRSSSTGGKLYVDGSQVGSSFDPTTVSGDITSTAALLVGMHPDGSLDCNFRGGIDEVVMYNRPLSATEIQNVFAAGPP